MFLTIGLDIKYYRLRIHTPKIIHKNKTPEGKFRSRVIKKSLAMTYFHMDYSTLSSARSGFTSEFGMGSGGSRLLWSPDIRSQWTELCSCVLFPIHSLLISSSNKKIKFKTKTKTINNYLYSFSKQLW